MQLTTKLFCCAICATLPLALNAAPLKAGSSKASSVKTSSTKAVKSAKAAKATRHKLKSKHGVKKVTARPGDTKAVAIHDSAPKLMLSPATVNVVGTEVSRSTPVAATSVPVTRVNPYLAVQYAQAANNPYLVAPVVAPKAMPAENPYLAKSSAPAQPASPWSMPPVAALVVPPTPQIMPSPPATPGPVGASPVSGGNPYLGATSAPPLGGREVSAPMLAKLDPLQDLNNLFNSVRNGIPLLNGQDLLPTVKKVYPTGEKPLVILSFKCPTEMLGVTPPPMKALHEAVNFAFDGINKTNLLSFNMQQVCQ